MYVASTVGVAPRSALTEASYGPAAYGGVGGVGGVVTGGGGGAGSARIAEPVFSSDFASARIPALSTSVVTEGSFQLTGSELASLNASQVLLATTATALDVPAITLPRESDAVHGTTASAAEGLAGTLASVPPIVGQCLIAAKTMSGNQVSMPYFALPSTLAGMSTRGTGFPISRKAAGLVSRRSAGTVCVAAVAASAAYVHASLDVPPV